MEAVLPFVTTPVASQLTGISTGKLREWTSRRALVPADVRPKGKGSPAKFRWQTILILRIAVLLRDGFSLELQAHKGSFADLRKELRARSFIALWGRRLAFSPTGGWLLVEETDQSPLGDFLLIELDPHLRILRDHFAFPDATVVAGQLDLFSLPSVQGQPPVGATDRVIRSTATSERRSA
jgi:hypothetical protein